MVRVIEYDKLYRINTYGRRFIVEVDSSYSEKVKEVAGQLDLTCSGYERNLLVYLAELTLQGYEILSVNELKIDGSKPKVSYKNDKDFKKLIKYFQEIK